VQAGELRTGGRPAGWMLVWFHPSGWMLVWCHPTGWMLVWCHPAEWMDAGMVSSSWMAAGMVSPSWMDGCWYGVATGTVGREVDAHSHHGGWSVKDENLVISGGGGSIFW